MGHDEAGQPTTTKSAAATAATAAAAAAAAAADEGCVCRCRLSKGRRTHQSGT